MPLGRPDSRRGWPDAYEWRAEAGCAGGIGLGKVRNLRVGEALGIGTEREECGDEQKVLSH